MTMPAHRLLTVAVAALIAATATSSIALGTSDVIRFADAEESIASMVVADLAGDEAAAYRWVPASLCRDVPTDAIGHYLPGEPPPETPHAMFESAATLDACVWSTRQDAEFGLVSVTLSEATVDDLPFDEYGATRDDLPEWLSEERISDGVSVFKTHPVGEMADSGGHFAFVLYERLGLSVDLHGQMGDGGADGLHRMAVAIAEAVPAERLNPEVGPSYRDWLVENGFASTQVMNGRERDARRRAEWDDRGGAGGRP